MTTGPSPLRVAFSILRARRVRRPRPSGEGSTNHGELASVLDSLAAGGVPALAGDRRRLGGYRDRLSSLDPDLMPRPQALAYWLNLYNAGALDLAARASETHEATVLRVPGAFDTPWAEVAGEELSLNDIEHGKIRRFGDPRIHGALVCGSASCPTLRLEPYDGPRLDRQLDDQLAGFLRAGGAVVDRYEGVVHLSRVFLWYGADFVRPRRMPTLVPARKTMVLRAVARWLNPEDAAWVETTRPRIRFQDYDWGLACSVGVPRRTGES